MNQDTLFYILAPIAVLIAGISKSGFGTGLGVLAVPLMAIVIPPAQAAAIMLPLLCVMDIFNVWQYRRSWDRENLVILLPAALVGIALGSFTFRYLSDAHIRILIGVIAIFFVGIFFFERTNQTKTSPDRKRGSFWGLIAGFASFGVHAGGPPVSIYLLPQRLEKSIYVGTTVIYFTVGNYVKLVPYYFLGQLNLENLTTSLWLSPVIPFGLWLGLMLHKKVNERWFYNLAYLFLLLAGAKLLTDGFSAL